MFNRDKLRNTSNVSVSKHNIFYRNNEGCWAKTCGASLENVDSGLLSESEILLRTLEREKYFTPILDSIDSSSA